MSPAPSHSTLRPAPTGVSSAASVHGLCAIVLFAACLLPAVLHASPLADSLRIAGHFGGWVGACQVLDPYVYYGRGSTFAIADVSGTVPVPVASLPLPNGIEVQRLVVSGGIAYTICGDDRLMIFDVSTPAAPTLLSTLILGGVTTAPFTTGITKKDSVIYVLCGSNGYRVISVANPAAPRLLLSSPLHSKAMTTWNTFGYHLIDNSGTPALVIQTIANPASPVEISRTNLLGDCRSISNIGKVIYIATGDGIRVINANEPSNPVSGTPITPSRSFETVVCTEKNLYATALPPSTPGRTIYIHTALDPMKPVVASQVDYPEAVWDMSASNGRICCASGGTLGLVDAIDPNAPSPPGFLPNPPAPSGAGGDGNVIYLTDYNGIHRLTTTDPNAPNYTHHWPQFPNHARPQVNGRWLYTVNQMNNTFSIIDVLDPNAPVQRSSMPPSSGIIEDYARLGDQVFLIRRSPSSVEIIELPDPNAPTRRGSVAVPGTPVAIVVPDSGKKAIVAFQDTPTGGLAMVDYSNPGAPTSNWRMNLPGQPVAMSLDRTNLYVAFNDANAGTGTVWVYDLRNLGALTLTGQFSLPGTVVDVHARNDRALVPMDPGQSWLLHYVGPGSMVAKGDATLTSGFTEITGVQIAAPAMAWLQSVVSGEVSGYVFSGHKETSPTRIVEASKGVYIVTTRPPNPPVRRDLSLAVQPPQAASDGCTTNPAPGTHSYAVNEQVGITAIPNTDKSWNFRQWTGDVSGTSASASVVMDRNKVAIANFVQPSLLLAGGRGRDVLCPACLQCPQRSDTVLSFRLCTDEDDDWMVYSVTFHADGSGNEATDIANVVLYMGDDKVGEARYTSDNGTVQFSLDKKIPLNDCRYFTLVYVFTSTPPPTPQVREYAVSITTADVSALPMHYPLGLKYPPPNQPVTGGPLVVGPVLNEKTRMVYPTIQAAIDGANHGDVLLACPGVYNENVNVNMQVRVKSMEGPAMTTILAADSAHPAVDIRKGLTTLEGFTVTRSREGVSINSGTGGATGAVNVENCIITGNHDGVKITISGYVTISNGTVIRGSSECAVLAANAHHLGFSNLRVENNRMGIVLGMTEQAFINECAFTDNRGTSVFSTLSTMVDVHDCLFRDNGGPVVHHQKLRSGSIERSMFSGNTGGAVLLEGGLIVNIEQNTFVDNHAALGSTTQDKGILAIGDNPGDIDVTLNTISGNDGTGLVIGKCCNTRISSNVISNNSMGGIHIGKEASPLTLQANEVTGHRNGHSGVRLVEADGTRLENMLVKNNDYGVDAFACSNIAIVGGWYTNNRASDPTQGLGSAILFQKTRQSRIEDATIQENEIGIGMDYSTGISITNCSIWYNANEAIRSNHSSYTASGNSIWFNGLPFMKGNPAAVVNTASAAMLAHNDLRANTGDAVLFEEGSTGTLRGNTLEGNTSAGVRNRDDAVTIDARNNWWAAPSGPGGEGPGTGEEVFGRVDYAPWSNARTGLVCIPAQDTLTVPSGETADLKVHLANLAEQTDSVELTVTDASGWFTPAFVTIAAWDSSAGAVVSVPITVPASPTQGGNIIHLHARSLLHGGTADTAVTVVFELPWLTRIRIAADTIRLKPGGRALLEASGFDQFNRERPVTLEWTVGGGAIDSASIYTAGTQPGTFAGRGRFIPADLTADFTIIIDAGPVVIAEVTAVPGTVVLNPGGMVTLAMVGTDQFGETHVLAAQWTPTGGSMQGAVYTAGSQTGTFTITGSDGNGHSAVVSVTIVPAGFTLLAPTDGAAGLPPYLHLSWQAHPAAGLYRVQVATDDRFTDLVVDDSLLRSTELRIAARPQLRQYWRVLVRGVDGSIVASPTWSFTTRNRLPAIIALTSPVDGLGRLPLSVPCSWAGSVGFNRYRITLSRNPSMTPTDLVDSSITSPSFQLTGLQHKTTYHWKVDGILSDGGSVSSPVWSFTTADTTSTGIHLPAAVSDLVLHVHPNPSTGSASIACVLPEDADVLLELHSMTGECVAVRTFPHRTRGAQVFPWDAVGLPSGVYSVTVTTRAAAGAAQRRGFARVALVR